jgi:hypothetical protein
LLWLFRFLVFMVLFSFHTIIAAEGSTLFLTWSIACLRLLVSSLFGRVMYSRSESIEISICVFSVCLFVCMYVCMYVCKDVVIPGKSLRFQEVFLNEGGGQNIFCIALAWYMLDFHKSTIFWIIQVLRIALFLSDDITWRHLYLDLMFSVRPSWKVRHFSRRSPAAG